MSEYFDGDNAVTYYTASRNWIAVNDPQPSAQLHYVDHDE